MYLNGNVPHYASRQHFSCPHQRIVLRSFNIYLHQIASMYLKRSKQLGESEALNFFRRKWILGAPEQRSRARIHVRSQRKLRPPSLRRNDGFDQSDILTMICVKIHSQHFLEASLRFNRDHDTFGANQSGSDHGKVSLVCAQVNKYGSWLEVFRQECSCRRFVFPTEETRTKIGHGVHIEIAMFAVNKPSLVQA